MMIRRITSPIQNGMTTMTNNMDNLKEEYEDCPAKPKH